jgi:putative endonuclease
MIVYIIYSNQLDTYYTGFCQEDFESRLQKHCNGFYDNSYTKKTNDWQLFLLIECQSKKQALQIEKHIKKMKSKVYIKNLALFPEMIHKLKTKFK